MAKYIGRRCSVGIAKETTRGTPVNPTYWIPFATVSFDDKIDKARSEGAFAVLEDTENAYIVGKRSEGEIEFEMTDKFIGLFLYSLLGSVSTSNPETGVYTHSFTLSNSNTHPSLSILTQDPIESTMFPLCVVDTLTIKVEPQGIVKWTVGIKGRGGNSWTTQSTNFTSVGNKFLSQHLKLKLATNIAGLASASVIYPKSLEITFNQNVIQDFVAGTVQVNDNINQQFSIEGNIELNREDNTYRNYMLNNTVRAMEINFLHTTLIGATKYPQLQMQFPNVDFYEWEQDRALDSIVTEKINFKCNYDTVNGYNSIYLCKLTNNVVSY